MSFLVSAVGEEVSSIFWVSVTTVCVLQVVGGRLEAEVLQEQVWRGRVRWGFQAEGGPVVRGGSLLGTALLLPGNWSHTVGSVLCANEHVFSSDVFFFFLFVFFFSCWETYSHWFIKPLLHPDASFRNRLIVFFELWTPSFHYIPRSKLNFHLYKWRGRCI